MGLLAAADVSRWLARFQPDVVHIHHPFPLSVAALLLARARHIPVVATNHTIPTCSLWGLRGAPVLYSAVERGFSRWILEVLRRCVAVATPTSTAARALREIGFAGPIEVISNGVDTRRFSPGEADSELGTRLGLSGRPVVLYTGRLDAEKQMDVWLRAAARLCESVEVEFLVGGQGSDRDRLEALARELGIADRMCFFGYLPEEEFAAVYRAADVFLVTSPVELQSISTLEAAASGLPIVGVRAGALPELVQNGRNGYVVEPGDWRAASAALASILLSSRKRDEMAAQSRAIAAEHEVTASIRQYDQFLQRAVRKQHEVVGEPTTATGR
jgi:glycosyltransferase involved in cell wall biosynthesis